MLPLRGTVLCFHGRKNPYGTHSRERHGRFAYNLAMGTSIGERVSKAPGVCGDRTCIAGHRVRVLDIVIWHEHQGLTPDEIVSQIPSISLADVHAALAYYFDHRAEIQEEIRAERAQADQFQRTAFSLLATKLTPSGSKEGS